MDDQTKSINSSQGMKFPPLNVEGEKTNNKLGDIIEMAQVWGASLDSKAHC